MGIEIQSNSASLNAQRNLLQTTSRLNTSLQRQASGFRINNAADDAAGLIISNQLSSQIVSQNVGIRNANDGISIAQVAEGALQEVTNILQRTRELALSAANGTTSDAGRAALNAEFQALGEELSRISGSTSFGGQNLLSGNTTFEIQTGAEAGDTIAVETTDVTNVGAAISSASLLTAEDASAVLGVIEQQLSTVDSVRGELGASQNRLSSTISNQQNIIENVASSRSRIRDADFASETSDRAKNSILQNIGLAISAQANVSNQAALSLLK